MAQPIELPAAIGFEEFEFTPVRTRDVAAMEGRRTETSDSVTPYWRLSAQTNFLLPDLVDEMDTWLMQVCDGGGLFLAHDVYRPRPRAYGEEPLSGLRAAGGAFDGTATLIAVNSRREVVLSGLPSGFEINRGCHIGFRRSATIRSVHRVTEDAVANGVGQAVVKFVFGLDPMFVPAGTTVDFEKPSCVMSLDQGFSLPKAWTGRRASFSAIEVFFS